MTFIVLPASIVEESSTSLPGCTVVETTRPIIPEDELWLYRDKTVLARLTLGLAQASEGKGRILSFARYARAE